MHRAVIVVRDWLAQPADSFAARLLVLFMLLLEGPVGMAAGIWYLLSGDVHGGRLAALVLLAYAAAATAFLVLGWRASGRIWHLAIGVLLIVPVSWIDAWVTEDTHRQRFPGFAVLLTAGLIYNLSRYVWRTRRVPPPDAPQERPAVDGEQVAG